MLESLQPTQKSVNKNTNVYFVLTAGLAIWFLFIHSPPLLIARKFYEDVAFVVHLVGAYSIYVGCICNVLVTPSVNKSVHVWVGRTAMCMGVVSFVAGLYLCYWPLRESLPPLGFSVGITIGGVLQVYLQYQGYKAIREFQSLRDKLVLLDSENASVMDPLNSEAREDLEGRKTAALHNHVNNMIALFVAGCGIPAAMRVLPLVGADGVMAIVIVVVVLIAVGNFYSDHLKKRM